MVKRISLDKITIFFRNKGIERQINLLFAILFLSIFLSFYSRHFLTLRNIINLSRQISISGIFAVGMTFIILIGEIDLSVGSIISLSGLFLVGITKDYGLLLGIMACLFTGMAIGLVNGLLVVKGKMPSFAATLSMSLLVSGIALVYCKGSPIVGLPNEFRELGRGFLLGIPLPFYYFFILLVFSGLLLSKLKIGRYIYAVGGNINAAKLRGINILKVKIFVFITMGLLASFGGMILITRTNTATVYMGNGKELEAIAMAVVGGTLLSGGVGNIFGTFLGVSLLTIINNSLNLLGVSSDFQYVARGCIILLSLLTQKTTRK